MKETHAERAHRIACCAGPDLAPLLEKEFKAVEKRAELARAGLAMRIGDL